MRKLTRYERHAFVLLLVANTAVLCCCRFASALDFSAAGDEFSTRAESSTYAFNRRQGDR
jgi:hypothetical protein